ncbi:hypothetical protein ACG7TL_001521 [Trametes sanguinea]
MPSQKHDARDPFRDRFVYEDASPSRRSKSVTFSEVNDASDSGRVRETAQEHGRNRLFDENHASVPLSASARCNWSVSAALVGSLAVLALLFGLYAAPQSSWDTCHESSASTVAIVLGRLAIEIRLGQCCEGNPVSPPATDGEDPVPSPDIPSSVMEYVERVVHLALRDPVRMRDFALYADGARIVHSLTASHLTKSAIKHVGSAHSPEVALSDDNHIGRCWSSARKGGQLGIVLPELVRPTHVTIDHIPAEIAAMPGQAPRDMRLWGVIDGDVNHDIFQSLTKSATPSTMNYRGPPVSGGYQFVQLATIEYDINALAQIQTFELERDVVASAARGFPYDTVPMIGRKRQVPGRDAHTFEFGKIQKRTDADTAGPLMLPHEPLQDMRPNNRTPVRYNGTRGQSRRRNQAAPSGRGISLLAHQRRPYDSSPGDGASQSSGLPLGSSLLPPALPQPSTVHNDDGGSRQGGTSQAFDPLLSHQTHEHQDLSLVTPPTLPPVFYDSSQAEAGQAEVPADNALHSYTHQAPTHAELSAPSEAVVPRPNSGVSIGYHQQAVGALDHSPNPSLASDHGLATGRPAPSNDTAYAPPGPGAMEHYSVQGGVPAPSSAPSGFFPAGTSELNIDSRLLEGVRMLYWVEFQTDITFVEAANLWPQMSQEQQRYVYEQYVHMLPTTQVSQIAQNPQFTSHAGVNCSPVEHTSCAPQLDHASTSMASQTQSVLPETPNRQLTMEVADEAYDLALAHNTASASSSLEDIGFKELEEAALQPDHVSSTPSVSGREAPKVPIREGQLKRTTGAKTRRTQRPVVRKANKGKARATIIPDLDEDEDKDGDDDDDEIVIHMDEDDETESAASEASTVRFRRRPSYEEHQRRGDEAGHINTDMALLLFQKIESIVGVVQNFVDVVKASTESNQSFQKLMSDELKAIRECVGLSGGHTTGAESRSGPSTPAKKMKSTPTKGSDRRVAKRIARVRGEDPDEDDDSYSIFKCHDLSAIAKRFPPLTEDEITSYTSGDGTTVCDPEHFRIDFEKSWKKFSFNKEAREVLIRTFLAQAEGGSFANDPVPAEYLNREQVGLVVDTYIATLRRAYRDAVKSASPESGSEASDDEASNDKAKAKRASQTSRMSTLYRARLFTVLHVPSLQCHQALFARMSAVNMSGDETDGPEVRHPPVYRIIIAEWQSLELRTFLWRLDAWYLEAWEKPLHGRRTGGNPPRTRIVREGGDSVRGVPPARLWRNCYDAAWLATLPEWEVEMLEIVEEDYPFGLQ